MYYKMTAPRLLVVVALSLLLSLKAELVFTKSSSSDDSSKCRNVTFTTPIQTKGPYAQYCYSSVLIPHPSSKSETAFFKGKELDPNCWTANGCWTLLCDDDYPSDGIVTISTTFYDYWGVQLKVDGEVIPPSATCMDTVPHDLNFVCSCADSMALLSNYCYYYPSGDCDYTPIAYYYIPPKTVENNDDDDDDNGKDGEEDNKNGNGNDQKDIIIGVAAASGGSIGILMIGIYAFRRRKAAKEKKKESDFILKAEDVESNSLKTIPTVLPPPPPSTQSKHMSPLSLPEAAPIPGPMSLTSKTTEKSSAKIGAIVARDNLESIVTFSSSELSKTSKSKKHGKKRKKDTLTAKERSELVGRFKSFLSTSPKSNLGEFLRTRISVNSNRSDATYRTFGTSLLSTLDDIDVESIKSSITNGDRKRFSRLKATVSARMTSPSALEAIAGNSKELARVTMKHPQLVRTSKQLYPRAEDLVKAVCKRLEKETVTSEEAAGSDFYSGSEVPGISIEDYIYRLMLGLDRWFNEKDAINDMKGVGIRSLLISLVYLQKMKAKEPNFVLSVYNRHRLFAISMLLAAKFSEDCLISNVYWAKVCGVDVEDINEVEEEFCKTTDFDFWVSTAHMQSVYDEFKLGKLLRNSLSSEV